MALLELEDEYVTARILDGVGLLEVFAEFPEMVQQYRHIAHCVENLVREHGLSAVKAIEVCLERQIPQYEKRGLPLWAWIAIGLVVGLMLKG